MSISRTVSVARLNLLLQAQEPSIPILMTIIPIVLTPFMVPGNRNTLLAEGYTHATGAEQAVPGFAILFSFFQSNSSFRCSSTNSTGERGSACVHHRSLLQTLSQVKQV